MNTLIRPFSPEDREALLQIGAETAFFGAPIERYMEDRRIFMDAFYAYYTDYEPQHSWVACVDGQVTGFLTGCVDSGAHSQVMSRCILPGVVARWLRGYYKPGRKTLQYALATAGAALRGEIPAAPLDQYPAHLHINLLPGWRGLGLGRQLMNAYIDQLRQLHIAGVHLHTTNLNSAACHLYEKTGFRLVDSRATLMYAHLTDLRVENRCYGLRL